MQFRILGPVELWWDDQPVALAPKQQVVLAALLLRAHQVAPADWLIEQLWGARPPATARKTLQSLVLRLRRVLPPGTLLTRQPGYLLRVEAGQFDLSRFQQGVEAAAAAAAAGDDEQAAARLREALALWRGPALAGVDSDALQQTEAPRLEELRLGALEARVDAELRLGRHAELVAELKALTAEHPLRERFWGQLMLALYRSDRQAEALAAYRQLRQRLVEELGIEPSAELQRLQREILAAAPALALPDTAASPAGAASARPGQGEAAVVPRQLPPDIAGFTGRQQELERLRALLGGERGGRVLIAAINGAAGVGKSALAIHAAHQLAERFPDGQLYADLQGVTAGLAPLPPLEVLGRFLRALGVESRQLSANVEEAAALFRSLVAGRRLLVVLDNAASAEQVRPLLPAGPGCAVLVTSRRLLTGIHGAEHLHLDVLLEGEAVRLLDRLAGPERAAAEPEAVAALARLCGYLPLALRIAGGRLAARPSWPVRALVDRLADERRRLDELALGELAVRASFQVSYQALQAGEPSGARVFRLLGLLDGPDVGAPAVAALLDQPVEAAEAALERLVDAHLLASPAPGRYRLHDLLRLFARERAAADEPPSERAAALTRALRFYAATAERADRIIRPGRSPGTEAGHEAERALAFEGLGDALAWLEAERPNLLTAVHQAATTPGVPWQLAGRLAAALLGFFYLRSYVRDCKQVNEVALAAARQHGDRYLEAQALHDLGALAERLSHENGTQAVLERSLALRQEIGDRRGEAESLNALGVVRANQGHFDQALALLQRSLELYREVGDRRGEGVVLNNLGIVYTKQGQFSEAIACFKQDLAICREIGDHHGASLTLASLGDAYRRQGDYQQATACYQESLAISWPVGDRFNAAESLRGLGEALRLQGQLRDAIDHYEQALDLYRQVGAREGEAAALRHLGLALHDAGRHQEAVACWRGAAVLERLGGPGVEEVRALPGQCGAEPARA